MPTHGLVLPFTNGMTIEKAKSYCGLAYEVADRAVYFKLMDSYPPIVIHKINSICPNCKSTNVLTVVFYNEKNAKLEGEGKAIIAPDAYGALVRHGSYLL